MKKIRKRYDVRRTGACSIESWNRQEEGVCVWWAPPKFYFSALLLLIVWHSWSIALRSSDVIFRLVFFFTLAQPHFCAGR